VSILVDAAVVVGGIALGRWIIRSVRARRAPRGAGAGAPPVLKGEAEGALFAAFPCKVGDVVMRSAERDELWLAGALVFREEGPVAALFAAPEAGGDRALFVRAVPGAGVVWLSPLPAAVVRSTGDPPHAVEVDGVRYERARRLPVSVSRVGSGAPAAGDRAIVAEYTGPANARLLVVAGSDSTLAWRGVALADGEYDVLPGATEP
jgi:hypothetical protein